MPNFSFYSYCAIYSAREKKKLVFDNMKDDGREAVCFSSTFIYLDQLDKHKKYYLEYKITAFHGKAKAKNNYCPFTKEECIEWINYLKNIMSIKCEIESLRNKFIINIKVNTTPLGHKLALTWVRYLYEWPYAGMVMDTLKIKKANVDGFKRFGPINTMGLITGSLDNYVGSGHSIFRLNPGDLINKKTQKEIISFLNESENNRLNLMYDINNEADTVLIKMNHMSATEEWEDDEKFKKRLNVYKHNRKLVK